MGLGLGLEARIGPIDLQEVSTYKGHRCARRRALGRAIRRDVAVGVEGGGVQTRQ